MIIGLFLFNMTGFYWLQNVLINNEQEKFSIQLDKQIYDESNLVEIRMPLSMPYYQNTEYIRTDGRINIKGVEYSYVKRKIENGYLVLKCIPNAGAQLIKEKTADYFAEANGIDKNTSQNSGHSKSTIKISLDDFDEQLSSNQFGTFKLYSLTFSEYLLAQPNMVWQMTCEQPPEIIC